MAKTKTKSSSDIPGVSGAYEQFSNGVAAQTGLSPSVIAAWTLAEGGPADNPLNIGPGQHYGSVQGAIAATVKLLKTSTYSGIISSAGKPLGQQVAAIAASPWCPGCPGYQQLLLGTLRRTGHIKGGAVSASSNGGAQTTLAVNLDPIPGGPTIDPTAPFKGAESLLSFPGQFIDAAEGFVTIAKDVTSLSFWIRVGEVISGLVLIHMGLKHLSSSYGSTSGRAGGGVKKAASTAAEVAVLAPK